MGGDSALPKFTKYELVVKRIYELLSPTCKVIHDDKIKGKDSGTLRQIDVSIRGAVGPHEVLVIVQCKDQRQRVDVNQIHELAGVMEDVGAQHGVMVSNSGFSKSARRLAVRKGIDTCMIHDAEAKDWRLELKLPVVWEEVTPVVQWDLIGNAKAGMQLTGEIIQTVSGINLIDVFLADWNAGKLPLDGTSHEYPISIKDPKLMTVNGEELSLQSVQMRYLLKRDYFFGYLDQLPHAKAIQDIEGGKTHVIIPGGDLLDPRTHGFVPYSSIEAMPVKIGTRLTVLRRPILTRENVGPTTFTIAQLQDSSSKPSSSDSPS